MKNKILICLIILAALGGLATNGFSREKAKIIIKMATIAPKGHVLSTRMEEFNRKIIKLTHNEVAFKVYWGGVQGDGKNVLRKIRLGQLHGGFFGGGALGQIVPSIRVTEIPYIFKSNAEVAYVREQLADEMRKKFEDKGYIVLGWANVGFIYNFSKIPINSLETLRTLKCWVPEDDVMGHAIYEALGITPVSLSINDVMTSVSANLIDTAAMTPFGAAAFRFYTRFKYMSNFPALHILGADLVSKRIWKKISPESRKIILTTMQKYAKERNAKLVSVNQESIELLKSEGVHIVKVDPASKDLQFLIEAGKKARESQVGKLYSQELLDRTLSLLDEYRKAHPESASNTPFNFIE